MAKHIEVIGLSSGGGAEFRRDGKSLTKDDWWKLLTPELKNDRLMQAWGSWHGIQEVGIERAFNVAFQSYVDEK